MKISPSGFMAIIILAVSLLLAGLVTVIKTAEREPETVYIIIEK
jgi:hypothetical protein